MESMKEFFTARVQGYDAHMLEEVTGCREGYEKMAELVPEQTQSLLDLGCGTGLELEPIFQRFPGLQVTGIDLTQAMLVQLRAKFPHKNLTLIEGDYFSVELGKSRFDVAVSFQTMHHFSKEKKGELYRRIFQALKPGGVYMECDYMVETQEEEDFAFAENRRIRRELGIPEEAFYHYDTPCTIQNQQALLLQAGFSRSEMVWRKESTTLLFSQKPGSDGEKVDKNFLQKS